MERLLHYTKNFVLNGLIGMILFYPVFWLGELMYERFSPTSWWFEYVGEKVIPAKDSFLERETIEAYSFNWFKKDQKVQ